MLKLREREEESCAIAPRGSPVKLQTLLMSNPRAAIFLPNTKFSPIPYKL